LAAGSSCAGPNVKTCAADRSSRSDAGNIEIDELFNGHGETASLTRRRARNVTHIVRGIRARVFNYIAHRAMGVVLNRKGESRGVSRGHVRAAATVPARGKFSKIRRV